MSESVKTRRSSLGRKTGSGYGKSFAKKRSESTATAKKSPVVLGPSKTDFNGLNPFSLDERPNRILTESQMDSLSLYYQTVTTNPDRKEVFFFLHPFFILFPDSLFYPYPLFLKISPLSFFLFQKKSLLPFSKQSDRKG